MAGKHFENTLLIRRVGGRSFNKTAAKTVLRELWTFTAGVKFTETEGNILLAKFHNKTDMGKVLYGGPWRFMGWALEVEQ